MTFPEILVWVFGAFGILLVVVLAAASIQNLVEILRMRRRHKAKMTTKTKLIILQIFSSIFQWGCVIAAIATLYYLVVGIQPGEPWTPFFIALAVNIICALFAAGFAALKKRASPDADAGLI